MVTYELVLEGESQVRKGSCSADKDPGLQAGGTVSGWTDTAGKIGIATGGGGGGGRGGGGYRGGGGGGKSFDRSPDHPLNMARALHTSCLSSAVPVFQQMAELNLLPKMPDNPDQYFKTLVWIAGHLKETYPQAVLDQAKQSPGSNGAAAQPEQVALPTEPEPEPVSVAGPGDEDIPF